MAGRAAVVIGINYETQAGSGSTRSGLTRLRFAEADAQEVATELKESGYTVACLLGQKATRTAILNAIQKKRDTAGSGGLLVFYFSGHGDVDPNDPDTAYLLPVNTNRNKLLASAIPLNTLAQTYLGGVNTALVLLDCCHSGWALGMKGSPPLNGGRALGMKGPPPLNDRGEPFRRSSPSLFAQAGQNRMVIAACPGDDVAREDGYLKHGIFTHYLLEHWRASINPITIATLYDILDISLSGRGLPHPVMSGTFASPPLLRPLHLADPDQRKRIYQMISSLNDQRWKALLIAVNKKEEAIPGSDRNAKINNLIYKMWEASQVAMLEKAAQDQSAAQQTEVSQRTTVDVPQPPSEQGVELRSELVNFISAFKFAQNSFEYTDITTWTNIIALGEQALNLEPQSADIRTRLASAYEYCSTFFQRMGKHSSAIDRLTRASSLDPANPRYYYLRGQTYQMKKDYDNAIKDFTQAIELDSQVPEYFFEQGVSYYLKGNYDHAITSLTQAITLNNQEERHYKWRAQSYHKKGDYAQAISDYTQAIQLGALDPCDYYLRGLSYELIGDHRSAQEDYDQAVDKGCEKKEAELAKL